MGHFQPLSMKHISVRVKSFREASPGKFHVSHTVLGNEHKIRYDIENVVDRTLTLQRPNMMLEKRVDTEVQLRRETLAVSRGARHPKRTPTSQST